MDEQYVIDLYREVLGREPDPAGLAHNLGLLQSGAISASDLAGAFAGSQEAQSSPTANPSAAPSYSPSEPSYSSSAPTVSDAQAKAQVAQLYQNILGRSPDAGAKGWENLLLAGYDISEVARQIGTSKEAQSKAVANISPELRANDPNNFAGSVTQLYASALGRTPDAASLEANVNLLNRNPDAFAWLADTVTKSPEAQAYAQKSGVDLNKAYENVVGNFEHFTPTPKQGGLAGFANQYGYLAPFLLAGGALAAPYLAGAGAAGAGTATGVGAGTGLTGGVGASGGLLASGGTVGGLSGAGTAAGIAGSQAAAGLGIAGGSALAGTGVALGGGLSTVGSLSPALPAAGSVGGAGAGLSAQLAPGTILGTGLPGGGAIGASYMAGANGLPATNIFGNPIPASSVSFGGYPTDAGILSNLPNLSGISDILKTPLGQLGAASGLSLLGGGGAQQQQPVPQMAGGSGTFAPRGQVDYRPIIDLLAPRQISRTSLLG